MTRKNYNISHSLDRVTSMQAEHILKLFPPNHNKHVLETGSGIGRLSHALYSRGYNVTGLEKSEEYTVFARENRPGPNYIHGDTSSLTDEVFDLIISVYNSFGCFSASTRPEVIIREMTSLLRPGGSLLLQVGSMTWARKHFSSKEPRIKNSAGDIHTTRIADWKTGKLITHFNCNGFEYSSSLQLFEQDEIEQQLMKTGFQEIDILNNLKGEKEGEKDHFFVVARNLYQKQAA
ncbi:MAG: class I SAM-dependent methyltransferase [Methyloligellaceae bacterium]